MGAPRTMYQIVGRYLDGKEVVGYHLQSLGSDKSGRYTREAVAYLVGRGQITNCKGQIYQNDLTLRGEGMSLESLPVQQSDGSLSKTGNIGHVRRGTEGHEAMTQLMIVGSIAKGRTTVGYYLQNAGGGRGRFERNKVMELAQQGKIGNARVQQYNGKLILRGINCDLRELPVEQI